MATRSALEVIQTSLPARTHRVNQASGTSFGHAMTQRHPWGIGALTVVRDGIAWAIDEQVWASIVDVREARPDRAEVTGRVCFGGLSDKGRSSSRRRTGIPVDRPFKTVGRGPAAQVTQADLLVRYRRSRRRAGRG